MQMNFNCPIKPNSGFLDPVSEARNIMYSFITKSNSSEIYFLTQVFLTAACVPDGRDVLGPLSVKCFCPLLKLVQLILDHFRFIAVSTLLCHGLRSKQIKMSN